MAVTPVSPDTTAGVDELVLVPFPSSPYWLSPQHSTVPFESRAQVSYALATSAVTPESPDTVTGVGEFVVLPLPSSPSRLSPQHCTVPSVISAQL
jgi:hypothetical protein